MLFFLRSLATLLLLKSSLSLNYICTLILVEMMGVAPMSLLMVKLYTTRLVNDYIRLIQLTLTLEFCYPKYGSILARKTTLTFTDKRRQTLMYRYH